MSRRVALIATLAVALLAPSRAAAFEFTGEGFKAAVYEGEGELTGQAGTHPYALSFDLDFEGAGGAEEDGLRDLTLEMPPGLFENPTATGQDYCTTGVNGEFRKPRESVWETSRSGESCRDNTQVGTIAVRSASGAFPERTFGLFNLVPKKGEPAELGARPYEKSIVFVPVIRQAEGEYRIALKVKEIPRDLQLAGLTVTIWGVPWAVANNEQRGECLNEVDPAHSWGKCSVGPPKDVNSKKVKAYLSMPTSCESPLTFVAIARSWQQEADMEPMPSSQAPLTGCEKLEFKPHATAVLSNPRASSPSGYAFDIVVDTSGVEEPVCTYEVTFFATGCAPTPVRKAVVTLPEGVRSTPRSAPASASAAQPSTMAETPTSPLRRRLPERVEDRRLRSQKPDRRRPARGLDLPRRSPRQPLRQPARDLPGCQVDPARHPGQGRRRAGAEPDHRPPHRNLRQAAPAALLRPQHPLPRRPAQPAGDPRRPAAPSPPRPT